jgi:hypothetical protein
LFDQRDHAAALASAMEAIRVVYVLVDHEKHRVGFGT